MTNNSTNAHLRQNCFCTARASVSSDCSATTASRRCPARAQWHVHYIFSWWVTYLSTSRFSFRHFREIGSNWKYQRISRVPFKPAIHKTDDLLLETFNRVDWNK